MNDFEKVIEQSVSEFPHLSIEGFDVREVSVKDYNELHCFLEDVREKHDKEVVFRFSEHEGYHDFQVELDTIGSQGLPDKMPFKRLIRTILQGKKDTFNEYWIENDRLFLRGDFPSKNREICLYGMELYDIKITDTGDQIREYVPLNINKKSIRNFRFAQILRKLDCLECGSDGNIAGFKKFSCQNCKWSIDLTELNFPLTMSINNIIRFIEEGHTHTS